ncbi:MAG: hypothetical protein ABFD50_07190 [Smithella sp.]
MIPVFMQHSGLSAAVKALFSSGEQGVWYDPSDLSTMFQDLAGTVPVTAVGQPVGRILDKSGRGNHATQSTAASRPILEIDGNGKYYLRFDGVDDSMSTSNINFTVTDKMMVFAGVRKLSDAARGIIFEIGNNQDNSFTLDAGALGLIPGPYYRFISRGSLVSFANTPGDFAAPITNILTGIGNISGDSAILRVNGSQVAISTTDQGTGNYGNYPLYIGSRAGNQLRFNGHLYSLIVRGAQSTNAQITRAETYVNSKTKAY